MKYLNSKILEAINSGVRLGLSLDDFDDTDNKLPILKKDIKSKSENNYIKTQQFFIQNQLESLDFDKHIVDKINEYHFIWKPTDDEKFRDVIRKYISVIGNDCDLNWIDTSNIYDMRGLFCYFINDFNGDISKWNVSNVKNMRAMFKDSKFNGDISKWDVSNVENMSRMFRHSSFNGDISKWDVSSVTDMSDMFSDSIFNKNISKWNIFNVKDIGYMFRNSKFNQDISKWDISNIEEFEYVFDNCPIKHKYMPQFKR